MVYMSIKTLKEGSSNIPARKWQCAGEYRQRLQACNCATIRTVCVELPLKERPRFLQPPFIFLPPGEAADNKAKASSTRTAASGDSSTCIVFKRGPGIQSMVVMGCFVACAVWLYLRWPSEYVFEKALPSSVLLWSGYLFWEDDQEVVLSSDSVSIQRTNLHSELIAMLGMNAYDCPL